MTQTCISGFVVNHRLARICPVRRKIITSCPYQCWVVKLFVLLKGQPGSRKGGAYNTESSVSPLSLVYIQTEAFSTGYVSSSDTPQFMSLVALIPNTFCTCNRSAHLKLTTSHGELDLPIDDLTQIPSDHSTMIPCSRLRTIPTHPSLTRSNSGLSCPQIMQIGSKQQRINGLDIIRARDRHSPIRRLRFIMG